MFSTFFGAFLGVAFLGVGSRHLMKKNPAWLSQYGENKLFGKITGNQYRLISAHFVAHSHRDSLLFRNQLGSKESDSMAIRSSVKSFTQTAESPGMHQISFLVTSGSYDYTQGKP